MSCCWSSSCWRPACHCGRLRLLGVAHRQMQQPWRTLRRRRCPCCGGRRWQRGWPGSCAASCGACSPHQAPRLGHLRPRAPPPPPRPPLLLLLHHCQSRQLRRARSHSIQCAPAVWKGKMRNCVVLAFRNPPPPAPRSRSRHRRRARRPGQPPWFPGRCSRCARDAADGDW